MGMSTYTDFAASVATWLNREGFTSLTDQVEDLTAMGQRRIHRLCNLRAMEEVDTAFDISSQSESHPSDYLRTKSITIVQGASHHPVLGRSLHTVLNQGQSGRPAYYANVGTNFYFGPTPDQSYTALLIYYKGLDIVSTTVSTNWILTNAPELLLFATLMEACLFLKDDNRAKVWEARFNQVKEDIERDEAEQDREGGALAVNAQ